jgi:hypothetical protein
MRRVTAILTVCLVAVAGCQGSAAQEPYDGVIAAVQRPAKAPVVPELRSPEAEPIASEVDVPWAIALLSDAMPAPVKKPGKVIVVDVDADVPETVVQAVDLDVAVDPPSAAEKPATPKTCSGVVKSRS